MNLLADENIDSEVVTILRERGHFIEYIAEISPSVNDDYILKKANEMS